MNYFKPIKYIYKKDKKKFLLVLFIENASTLISALATIKLSELIRNSNDIDIPSLISVIIFLCISSIFLKIFSIYQIKLFTKKVKLKIINDFFKFKKEYLISNKKKELLTIIGYQIL